MMLELKTKITAGVKRSFIRQLRNENNDRMDNSDRTTETRVKLVCRNTAEVLTKEELSALLAEKKKPTAYYGIAPTGPVHIGYLVPMSKIFDLKKAGVKTTVLLADIHAALDDRKSKWEELERKTEYYKKCTELAFDWGDASPIFRKGSDFELSKDYTADVLKLASLTTVSRAARAASEVTRMKDQKVGELMYPIMQALDEQYLGIDMQLGGIDQRHIMAFAREYLGELGYAKRVEVMTPLVASLQGPGIKMSASVPLSNIKIYESEISIRNKINKAYCPAGTVEDNPVLQIFKFLMLSTDSSVKINREERFGGDISVNSGDMLDKMFRNKEIHPADLKNAVSEYLVKRLKKSRDYFDTNQDMLRDLGDIFLP